MNRHLPVATAAPQAGPVATLHNAVQKPRYRVVQEPRYRVGVARVYAHPQDLLRYQMVGGFLSMSGTSQENAEARARSLLQNGMLGPDDARIAWTLPPGGLAGYHPKPAEFRVAHRVQLQGVCAARPTSSEARGRADAHAGPVADFAVRV